MAKLSPGVTLSHYHIVSEIGGGGRGEVYLAEHARLHRKVALKILPADLASNQDRVRLVHCADDPRFKEMLKRLNLPESISR